MPSRATVIFLFPLFLFASSLFAQTEVSPSPQMPNDTFHPAPPGFRAGPPNLIDSMTTIKNGDDYTIVPKGSILYSGSQSQVDVLKKVIMSKNFLNFKDFSTKYAKDVILLTGKYNHAEVEVKVSPKDKNARKITIVLDEKGNPAPKIKTL